MSGPKASSHTVVVSTRRSWAAWEKRALVDEAQRTTGSISAVARRHGITPSLLWRRWSFPLKSGPDGHGRRIIDTLARQRHRSGQIVSEWSRKRGYKQGYKIY